MILEDGTMDHERYIDEILPVLGDPKVLQHYEKSLYVISLSQFLIYF